MKIKKIVYKSDMLVWTMMQYTLSSNFINHIIGRRRGPVVECLTLDPEVPGSNPVRDEIRSVPLQSLNRREYWLFLQEAVIERD